MIMRKTKQRGLPWIGLVAILLTAPFANAINNRPLEWPAFDWVNDDLREQAQSFYQQAIEDRLELGINLSRFSLKKNRRPADESRQETFLGYINELHAEQSSTPRIAIGYRINPYLALNYTHDRVEARTWNFNNQLSDGVVRMSGPILSLIASYPVTDWLAPYAGFGYAPWKSSFDHDAWWTLGYGSPDAYQAAGSPPVTRETRRRLIRVDDRSGWILRGGVELRIHRHWLIDAGIRRHSLSTGAHFYHLQNGRRHLISSGDFDLSHTMVSLGLRGIF